MNVTADVKGRLLSTPYCPANPPDLLPIQKPSSSGLNGPKAHQLVMLYANGWRRLTRNLKHPRQKRTLLNGLRRKALGLKLMTTIQPLTPKWWSDFSCAINGIRTPPTPVRGGPSLPATEHPCAGPRHCDCLIRPGEPSGRRGFSCVKAVESQDQSALAALASQASLGRALA